MWSRPRFSLSIGSGALAGTVSSKAGFCKRPGSALRPPSRYLNLCKGDRPTDPTSKGRRRATEPKGQPKKEIQVPQKAEAAGTGVTAAQAPQSPLQLPLRPKPVLETLPHASIVASRGALDRPLSFRAWSLRAHLKVLRSRAPFQGFLASTLHLRRCKRPPPADVLFPLPVPCEGVFDRETCFASSVAVVVALNLRLLQRPPNQAQSACPAPQEGAP